MRVSHFYQGDHVAIQVDQSCKARISFSSMHSQLEVTKFKICQFSLKTDVPNLMYAKFFPAIRYVACLPEQMDADALAPAYQTRPWMGMVHRWQDPAEALTRV